FAYEALTAFFLEAAFLGVLLFGRKLVPPWAHFVAALMIATGTLFSSFWILAANSWMQTPAGYEIVDGRFFPKDWVAIVFSPSFPPDPHGYRLLCHDGFRGRGGRRMADPQGTIRRRRPRHVVDDALAAHRPGSSADIPRRPARTQHRRASAGEGCRHRGALGYPAVLSAHAVRHSRSGQRDQSLRDRGALSRQPHPDP